MSAALNASLSTVKKKSKGLLSSAESAADDAMELKDLSEDVAQALGGMQLDAFDEDELLQELEAMVAPAPPEASAAVAPSVAAAAVARMPAAPTTAATTPAPAGMATASGSVWKAPCGRGRGRAIAAAAAARPEAVRRAPRLRRRRRAFP